MWNWKMEIIPFDMKSTHHALDTKYSFLNMHTWQYQRQEMLKIHEKFSIYA